MRASADLCETQGEEFGVLAVVWLMAPWVIYQRLSFMHEVGKPRRP